MDEEPKDSFKCGLKYADLFKIPVMPFEPEHPIDEFNQLTSQGFKLNLITGKYERSTDNAE